MSVERPCSVCLPDIDTILRATKPQLKHVNRLLDGVEALGDMIGCGKDRTVCMPLGRLQKEKLKIVKEVIPYVRKA